MDHISCKLSVFLWDSSPTFLTGAVNLDPLDTYDNAARDLGVMVDIQLTMPAHLSAANAVCWSAYDTCHTCAAGRSRDSRVRLFLAAWTTVTRCCSASSSHHDSLRTDNAGHEAVGSSGLNAWPPRRMTVSLPLHHRPAAHDQIVQRRDVWCSKNGRGLKLQDGTMADEVCEILTPSGALEFRTFWKMLCTVECGYLCRPTQ